jgi:hypothetical protein
MERRPCLMALIRRQLFSSFPFHHFTTKILQLTKIFLPFAVRNYCRPFYFLYCKQSVRCEIARASVVWHFREITQRPRKEESHFRKKGYTVAHFAEKENFFWIVANCNWTVNRATRAGNGEKVECALAVAAEGAENSDECRGGNLPKFQWNFFLFCSRSNKMPTVSAREGKEAASINLISSIQLCIFLCCCFFLAPIVFCIPRVILSYF